MKKIFKDKDKKKMISTENLYLLEFMSITESNYIPGKTILDGYHKYYERPTKNYVLGKKETTYDYKDIFTGTIYKEIHESYKPGNIRVRIISPIISNKDAITEDEATNILETKNFYVINKDSKENTKKVLEFFERFNSLSSINPEKAEEFAIDLINVYNDNYIEEKSEDGKNLLIKKK